MSGTRIAGIVIAAVGLVLLIFGLQSAESPADQVTEAVTGRYTEGTMWYIIIGIAALVGGGLLAAFGGGRGRP